VRDAARPGGRRSRPRSSSAALLPEGLGGDDSLTATVAVQKLQVRILPADLRALVGDFVNFCGFASTGHIAGHKNDPPEELAALINDLNSPNG
jgi:hypothetical protein